MKLPVTKRLGLPLGLFIGLLFFILMTSPSHLPLPLIMVPFVLIFLIIFYGIVYIGKSNISSHRRARIIRAGVLACIPVLLLILQSIHQLTIKDILITIGLVLLATYYLNKADFL